MLRRNGRVQLRSGSKPEELELSNVFRCSPNNGHSAVLHCPLPTWRPAVFFSNSLPIGTTRTPQKSSRSCRTMNVASVLDRFGRRRMVGAFLVFSDSQNRPHTHPCHPWPQWPEFGASRRASVSARVPAATARCATPRELSASAKGVILSAVAEAIYGASASQFPQAPEDARQ
jgi:hypothetical protein